MSYTFAELEISAAAFDEIKSKLEAAGYSQAFIHDPTRAADKPPADLIIDMHGLGLIRAAAPPAPTDTIPVSRKLFAFMLNALNGANMLLTRRMLPSMLPNVVADLADIIAKYREAALAGQLPGPEELAKEITASGAPSAEEVQRQQLEEKQTKLWRPGDPEPRLGKPKLN